MGRFAKWDPHEANSIIKLRNALDSGDDANERDAMGRTALMKALLYKKETGGQIGEDGDLKELIDASDLNVPDNAGRTAYDYLTSEVYDDDLEIDDYKLGDYIAAKMNKPLGFQHVVAAQAQGLVPGAGTGSSSNATNSSGSSNQTQAAPAPAAATVQRPNLEGLTKIQLTNLLLEEVKKDAPDLSFVSILLSKGANPYYEQPIRRVAFPILQSALDSKTYNRELVKLLVSKPSPTNRQIRHPWDIDVRKLVLTNDIELLDLFVRNGNVFLAVDDLLLFAIKNNKPDVVRFLGKEFKKWNNVDFARDSFTYLSETNNVALMSIFLNELDLKTTIPIPFLKSKEMLDLFLSKGLQFNDANSYTILISSDPETMEYAIQKGANVNAPREEGGGDYYPIDFHLSKGNMQAVQVLLDHGARLGKYRSLKKEMKAELAKLLQSSKNPTKSLISAVQSKIPSSEVKKLLSLEKVNVNQKDEYGMTPLMYAAKSGVKSVVQKMILKGASIYLKDNEGKTAFDHATDPKIKQILSPLWTGFIKEELENYKILDDPKIDPSMIGICPFCFELGDRDPTTCMIYNHDCTKGSSRIIHPRLYALFKQSHDGQNHYCMTCGRPCVVYHSHTVLVRSNDMNVPDDIIKSHIQNGAHYYGDNHGNSGDCILLGGGGIKEKFQRVNAFIRKANELQAQIGKITTAEATEQLIEAAWNAPLEAMDALSDNFDIEEVVVTPEQLKQKKDIQKKEREKILKRIPPSVMEELSNTVNDRPPIVLGAEKDKQANAAGAGAGVQEQDQQKGGYCIVEGGIHSDRRVTYQFIHRQPDGTYLTHEAQSAICGEDLVEGLKSQTDTSNPFRCFLGDGCKGIFYPDDLAGLVGIKADFLESYRTRFLEDQTSKLIGARRRKQRTYRKKRINKRKTRKI